ncbi:TPA: hypothetical protein PTV97_003347 [Clostridium botulinum]|nr:hypothetical protein [Clostridium botulinum]
MKMCKEYKRKYQEYSIKITYLNGDTEDINYKGINTSNYNDMLNLYRDIKEKYQDESVIINFLGKTDKGELGILFQKKIINKDAELKEYAEKVVNTEIEDIIKDIYNSFKLLNDKRKYSNEQINICNKKQDILLHKIEHFNNELGNEIKISIFDNIQAIRIQRRKLKEDLENLTNFNGMLCHYENKVNKRLTTEQVEKILTKALESIQKINNKQYDFLTDEKVEELKIMKEVRYKKQTERVKLMQQLKKEFDKIYCDESKMKIICYNKAKVC